MIDCTNAELSSQVVSHPPHRLAREQPSETGDLIVSYLESIGIEYVFGIPGGAVEPLFNALARSRRRGGLRPILARHESGAAFMADGYARETGRIGVCVATSGPGATNLLTGIACAFENGIPVLAITGQPALPSFGRRPFQESSCAGINVVGMFRHCTCYSALISHKDQVETHLVNALMRANQLQRPVHLSIPVDVMRSPIDHRSHATLAYDLPGLLVKPSLVDELTVRDLCNDIKRSLSMVFIIGGGCAEAMPPIMDLIGLTNALFVSTPDGKGIVDTHHRAYRGVFGFAGHASANDVLANEPDLIVAIGANMGEWNSSGWSKAVLNERLAHIDSSEERLMRTPMARLHVQGRIASVCERLVAMLRADIDVRAGRRARLVVAKGRATAELEDGARRGPEACPDNATPIRPQRLMHELSRRCPPATRFLTDTGNSTAWAVHYLQRCNRHVPDRPLAPVCDRDTGADARDRASAWLRVTMDFAPMGWAIGAAIGVARGNPRSPVVCITGDGSYLMNGQEITVASSEKLCVVFIVLNDGALGMVKHGQRLTGAEPIAFELPSVDFALMASAMGIPGHVIATPEDFDAFDFAAIFERAGPTLLDVRIDPEEVPPMGVRIKALMKDDEKRNRT